VLAMTGAATKPQCWASEVTVAVQRRPLSSEPQWCALATPRRHPRAWLRSPHRLPRYLLDQCHWVALRAPGSHGGLYGGPGSRRHSHTRTADLWTSCPPAQRSLMWIATPVHIISSSCKHVFEARRSRIWNQGDVQTALCRNRMPRQGLIKAHSQCLQSVVGGVCILRRSYRRGCKRVAFFDGHFHMCCAWLLFALALALGLCLMRAPHRAPGFSGARSFVQWIG
jgi:hypothetical protein